MSEDKDGKNPVVVKAPTYNELASLVDRLTSQLKVADGSTAVLEEIAKLKSSLDVKVQLDQTQPLEFRVLPDLAKGAGKFYGRESSVVAEDWLLAVRVGVRERLAVFLYPAIPENARGSRSEGLVPRSLVPRLGGIRKEISDDVCTRVKCI